MSLLNVNKIDPATGTALEIGTSGDTITVPSGATFNVAGTLQSGGAALGNNTPNFGAKATSNQTGLSSGGWTKVQFDTEYFDVGGGYDATNDKFVVPAGEGGKYYFTASDEIEVYAYYQDSSAAAGTITGVTSEVDTFFFGYKLAE
jgi:hypothetical protein